MLAGEEYANEVETANDVFRRIGGQDPPEQEPEDPVPPEPDAPVPGGAAIAVPEPPPGDDGQPDETGSTVERLEEGARLAKAQAVARAKAREKAAKEKPPTQAVTPEATTLVDDILDGPVRRGPGRPPGAKNRPKPGDGPLGEHGAA